MNDKTTPLFAIAADSLIMRLRAMARHEHDDLSIGDEAADRIEQLEQQQARTNEATIQRGEQ